MCTLRDMKTGMVAEYNQRNGKQCGYFEIDPFFDRHPVKCFEQWSNVFMSACPCGKQLLLRGFELFAACNLITVDFSENKFGVV